ncbi:MAG TPA: hypothetical protein VJN94_07245 [Candidatus Binataceae bacterium]|nr:hypothetical protein [Candidatus Binataceae bacterium]
MVGTFLPRSVIIDDLDFVRVAITPDKTDPPLVVDSNAVPALPIADEFLEPVSRRNAEILQRLCVVEHREFATSDVLDVPKSRAAVTVKERFGVLTPERPYHA